MTCLGFVHSDDYAVAVLGGLDCVENNAVAVDFRKRMTDIAAAACLDKLAVKSDVFLKAEPYSVGVTPCSRVRIERISERVCSYIADRVGKNRPSEKCYLHHVVVHVVAVLAVVDDACAVAALGEISPLVSAELKLRLIVACVVMGRIFCRTVSNFTACVATSDINGELSLEHLFTLVPVNCRIEVNRRLVLFKNDILSDRRFVELSYNADNAPKR